MPTIGINAAVNSRDFGTFRWQLNDKKLHQSAALWKGPRTSGIGPLPPTPSVWFRRATDDGATYYPLAHPPNPAWNASRADACSLPLIPAHKGERPSISAYFTRVFDALWRAMPGVHSA